MKRNNADPTIIKNKVNKLTSLDMDKWKKYQDRLTNAEMFQQQKLNEITKGPLPEKPQTAQASVKKPPLKGSFVETYKSIIEEPVTKEGEEAKPDTQIFIGRNNILTGKSNTISVSGALNMNKNLLDMSAKQYHQGVPSFLRSEAPFNVYDHNQIKGEEFVENVSLTRSEAKKRLQEQLEKLRNRKEYERKLFAEQIQTEEENFKI